MVSGRATYIGSIKYIVSTKTHLEDWKIEADFEKVKKTFASIFPSHTEPIENLAKAYNEQERVGPAPERSEVYTNIPVTVGLSNYKSLLLNVSSKVSEPSPADVKLEKELLRILKDKNVFANIISVSTSQFPSADLRLNLEIVEVRRKFSTSAFARSLIVVNGGLVDLKTGMNNGVFRVESACFAVLHAACNDAEFNLAAGQIVDYILRNMY
jgi:hypothetical protein